MLLPIWYAIYHGPNPTNTQLYKLVQSSITNLFILHTFYELWNLIFRVLFQIHVSKASILLLSLAFNVHVFATYRNKKKNKRYVCINLLVALKIFRLHFKLLSLVTAYFLNTALHHTSANNPSQVSIVDPRCRKVNHLVVFQGLRLRKTSRVIYYYNFGLLCWCEDLTLR